MAEPSYRPVKIASGATVQVPSGVPEELDDQIRTARTVDEAAEMIRAHLRGPRAVKACVFRTCAWTLPEESRPTLATARRREEEQLIDHLQAEHAEAIRQMWEAIR